MIAIQMALVANFFYLNITTLDTIQPFTESQDPDVVITGHQRWWEAFYREAGIITANEIHLPAGKKNLLKLTSSDVIHDWWIPQFGNKMDMIPGNKNFPW